MRLRRVRELLRAVGRPRRGLGLPALREPERGARLVRVRDRLVPSPESSFSSPALRSTSFGQRFLCALVEISARRDRDAPSRLSLILGAYRRRFRGGEDAWREIDFGWGKRGHFACFWKGRSIAHESLGLLPFMKEAVKALKLSDAERFHRLLHER